MADASAWLPLEGSQVFCVGVDKQSVRQEQQVATSSNPCIAEQAGSQSNAARGAKAERSPGEADDIFLINGGIELGTASCPGSPGSPRCNSLPMQHSFPDRQALAEPAERGVTSGPAASAAAHDTTAAKSVGRVQSAGALARDIRPNSQFPVNGAADFSSAYPGEEGRDDPAAGYAPADSFDGGQVQSNSSYSNLVRSMVRPASALSAGASPPNAAGQAAPEAAPRDAVDALYEADAARRPYQDSVHQAGGAAAHFNRLAVGQLDPDSRRVQGHPYVTSPWTLDGVLHRPLGQTAELMGDPRINGAAPFATRDSALVPSAPGRADALQSHSHLYALGPSLAPASAAAARHPESSELYVIPEPREPRTFFPEYYSRDQTSPVAAQAPAQSSQPGATLGFGEGVARRFQLGGAYGGSGSSINGGLAPPPGLAGAAPDNSSHPRLGQRGLRWTNSSNQQSASTGSLGQSDSFASVAPLYAGAGAPRPMRLDSSGSAADHHDQWAPSASAMDFALGRNGSAGDYADVEGKYQWRPISEVASMPHISEAAATGQGLHPSDYRRSYNDVAPYAAFATPPSMYSEANTGRQHIRSYGNLQSVTSKPLSGSHSLASDMHRTYNSSSSLHLPQQMSSGRVTGEHPLGEYPSRTLFVRNINSHTTDEELLQRFREFGEIRSLYTACKHRGFVMISYYDIRAAMQAKQCLQGHCLRQREMDIHFSVPKENSPEPDLNQGTLVVFNVDQSVPKALLLDVFARYGEVKEIRSTPGKDGHKFVEFFDARHANAALIGLNRASLNGRQLKIELSRPGGVRRARQHIHSNHSSAENLNNTHQHYPAQAHTYSAHAPGMRDLQTSPSYMPHREDPPSIRALLHGSDAADGSKSELAEGFIAMMRAISANAISDVSAPQQYAPVASERDAISRFLDDKQPFSHASPFAPGAPAAAAHRPSPAADVGAQRTACYRTDAAQQYDTAVSLSRSTMPGAPPPGLGGAAAFRGGAAADGAHTSATQSNTASTLAAAAASVATALARDPSIPPEQQELLLQKHLLQQLQQMQLHAVGQMVMDEMIAKEAALGHPPSVAPPCQRGEPEAARAVPAPRLPQTPPAHGTEYGGSMPDGSWQSGHSDLEGAHLGRRGDASSFVLDVERVARGEDRRTTLMIRNIPNKYSQKMLLQTIDEANRGTYDFLYLPIDFKNRCNVGYAFINMVSTDDVLALYKRFHNTRWDKFNSEKQCCISYARIQGRKALIHHFQNSSLMNEDKRCRPVLLAVGGDAAGVQEPFPAPKTRGVRVNKRGSRTGRRLDEENIGSHSDRPGLNFPASLTSNASDED